MLSRLAVVAVFALCLHCSSDPCRDEAPSIEIALAGDLDGAMSVEIVVEYDDVSRTLPMNLEGASVPQPQRVGLIPSPSLGAEVRIAAYGYSRVDARGTRVSAGEATVDVTLDGCNEARVELAPLGVAPRDGGVPVRDGGTPDTGRDAGDGDPDAGVPRDAGEDPRDGGPPPLECTAQVTRDSVMLYDFEELPRLDDLTGLSTSRWVSEAGAEPQGHVGPDGCGTALDLDGSGAMFIGTNDAITPASMDLWIHLHDEPTEAQGIVSRDATGQADPGHFTLFRTCDDYLVLRVQDQITSVYLCSDAPVPLDAWTHVAFSVSPQTSLFVDGVPQQQGPESIGLFGAQCSDFVPCGGALEMEPPTNGLPIVVGASAHEAMAGSEAGISRPFLGAIDNVHARSR